MILFDLNDIEAQKNSVETQVRNVQSSANISNDQNKIILMYSDLSKRLLNISQQINFMKLSLEDSQGSQNQFPV